MYLANTRDHMLDRNVKTIVKTALKAAGIGDAQICAALAVVEGKEADKATEIALVVNQATAARMLSVSRFTIRKLVSDNVLHPVKLRDAVRYSRAELERVAAGGLEH